MLAISPTIQMPCLMQFLRINNAVRSVLSRSRMEMLKPYPLILNSSWQERVTFPKGSLFRKRTTSHGLLETQSYLCARSRGNVRHVDISDQHHQWHPLGSSHSPPLRQAHQSTAESANGGRSMIDSDVIKVVADFIVEDSYETDGELEVENMCSAAEYRSAGFALNVSPVGSE